MLQMNVSLSIKALKNVQPQQRENKKNVNLAHVVQNKKNVDFDSRNLQTGTSNVLTSFGYRIVLFKSLYPLGSFLLVKFLRI